MKTVIRHLFLCNFKSYLMNFYGVDELVCEVHRLGVRVAAVQSGFHHRLVYDLGLTLSDDTTNLSPAYRPVVCERPPAAMSRWAG